MDSDDSSPQLPAAIVPVVNAIRVESVVSRHPVHRLARRGDIRIEVKETNPGGETTVKWKVSHNSEYGQPGPMAYKLDTLIVNRRIEEAPRPIPRMLRIGSLSDICRELGLADSGKNRSDIKKGFLQNAFAGITAKTEFRHKDGTERELEAAFTRYSVIFTGEKLPNGRKADAVYIILNDVFTNIINGAMARPLDYDYLKSLPPAPQRFYEILSYQMYAALKYDRPRAKLIYSEFCAHAPITRHVNWENARSQLNKLMKPHKDSGYIAKVDFQHRTDSEGRADWEMFFQPGPKARAEFRAFNKRGGPSVLEIEPPDAMPLLTSTELTEQELIQRGVTPEVARTLVAEQPEEKIRQQLEIFDYRMKSKRGERIEDPAAWLVAAIRSEHGHAAPKSFVSEAERQRREEARQAKEQAAAEARRRERERDEQEKQIKRKIAACLGAMTPEQRAKLDADSRAAADPEMLAAENGPMREMMSKLRLETFLRQQMEAENALPLIDA